MMNGNRTIGDSGSHLFQDIPNALSCQTCLDINRRKKSIAYRTCGNHFLLTCVGLKRNQANGISHWCCQSCLGRTILPIAGDARPQVNFVENITQCRVKLKSVTDNSKGAS